MAQPQFSQIVASAARELMVFSDLSSSALVGLSGGTTFIDLYAPSGTICEIVSLSLSAEPPTGATTGTHYLQVINTQSVGELLYGESTFGSQIRFKYGEWEIANSNKFPKVNQPVSVVRGTSFDSTIGLRFIYTNATNANQTGIRNIFANYKKRIIG